MGKWQYQLLIQKHLGIFWWKYSFLWVIKHLNQWCPSLRTDLASGSIDTVVTHFLTFHSRSLTYLLLSRVAQQLKTRIKYIPLGALHRSRHCLLSSPQHCHQLAIPNVQWTIVVAVFWWWKNT